MNFIQLSHCWFNLQQVELIEVHPTSNDGSCTHYTVLVGLTSGRTWSARDVDKKALDRFFQAFETAAACWPGRQTNHADLQHD